MKIPNKLTPFTKFCCTIGNLPSSYMISLSYEEQVLWLCDYLKNTVIPTINKNSEALEEVQQLYVTLKNYVDNYFDNLDVQEEINNKLDEMVEDGTLEDILKDYLNLNLTNYNFERIARLVGVNASNYKENSEEFNNAYGFTQGCCFTDNSFIVSKTNTNKVNNDAKICECDYNGNIIREITIPNAGHCSSMAFNKNLNEVYILPYINYPNNSYTNDLIIIDYTSFTIKNTLTLSETFSMCGFDKINNKFYVGGHNKIYECNPQNGDLTFLFNYDFSNYNFYNLLQDFTVYDDNFFFLFSSCALVKTNKNGEIKNISKINPVISNHGVGETEGIDILENGDLFVTSYAYRPFSYYGIINVFKTNIFTNNSDITITSGISQNPSNIYVDTSMNSKNPDGSEEKPYNNLTEALIDIIHRVNTSTIIIKENSDISKEYCFLDIPNVYINFNNCKITGLVARNTQLIIQNLMIENNSNIIDNYAPVDVIRSDSKFENSINIVNNKVNVENLIEFYNSSIILPDNINFSGNEPLNYKIRLFQNCTFKTKSINSINAITPSNSYFLQTIGNNETVEIPKEIIYSFKNCRLLKFSVYLVGSSPLKNKIIEHRMTGTELSSLNITLNSIIFEENSNLFVGDLYLTFDEENKTWTCTSDVKELSNGELINSSRKFGIQLASCEGN